MNNIATRNDRLAEAFDVGDVEQPSALVPISGSQMQVDVPRGAIKVAVQRDDQKILQRLRVLAAAAGEDWYYRFPVKTKGGGQDYIEGPSIRCALATARVYGNNEIDVRTQDMGDHWIFYARFVDFESGFSLTRAYQQRKSQKTMKTDTDRQMDIIFQVGQSKAIRNVITNALSLYTDFAHEEARNAIVARVGKNLDAYRQKVLARLSELMIETKRVENAIGRPADKWLAPDVARVIAEIQSVNDGMASADDLFPPIDVPDKKPERSDFTEQKAEIPAPDKKSAEQMAVQDEKITEEAEREADKLSKAAMNGEKEESALDRGIRLLKACKSERDIADLNETIKEELSGDEETEAWAKARAARIDEIKAAAAEKKPGKK